MVKFEDFKLSDPDWWQLGPSIGCAAGLLVVCCGCFGLLRFCCRGKRKAAATDAAAADEKDKDSSKAAEADPEAGNAADGEPPPGAGSAASPEVDASAADEEKDSTTLLSKEVKVNDPATENQITATDGDDGLMEPVIEVTEKAGGCWSSCCAAKSAPLAAAA